MTTKVTTIRLEEEQLSTIKELDINLSEWVRDKLKEEVLTLKEIDRRLENNKKERENLINMKNNVIQCNTEVTDISTKTDQEKRFLLETKLLLKRDPGFLEGRINLYINQFGIINKPTKKQFLKLLEGLE